MCDDLSPLLTRLFDLIFDTILSGFLNTLTNSVKGSTVVLMMVRNGACFMRIGREQSDLAKKYLI